jgi:predicted small secreted protein
MMRKYIILTVFLASFTFLMSGCNIIRGFIGADRIYFCEKYDPVNDFCEGKGEKFSIGSLAVLADLKKPIGVDEVFINVKDNSTGQNISNFPFTVKPEMDYINFKGVTFTSAGNYKVSLIKKDGSVIASNDLEIVN